METSESAMIQLIMLGDEPDKCAILGLSQAALPDRATDSCHVNRCEGCCEAALSAVGFVDLTASELDVDVF